MSDPNNPAAFHVVAIDEHGDVQSTSALVDFVRNNKHSDEALSTLALAIVRFGNGHGPFRWNRYAKGRAHCWGGGGAAEVYGLVIVEGPAPAVGSETEPRPRPQARVVPTEDGWAVVFRGRTCSPRWHDKGPAQAYARALRKGTRSQEFGAR